MCTADIETLDDLVAYALALQAVHGWLTAHTAQRALEALGMPLHSRTSAATTIWEWLDPTIDPDSGLWESRRQRGQLDMPRRRRDAEQAYAEWRAKHDLR